MENSIGPKRESGRFLLLVRLVIAWGSVIILGADVAITAAPTFRQLADLARIRLNYWGDLERRLKVPGAELEAMAPEVRAGVGLLRGAAAPSYRLSPAIQGEAVRLWIEETAWPTPYDPASHFVLRRGEENTSCRQLSATKGLAIDYCD